MAKVVDSSVLIGMERRGLGVEALPHLMPRTENVALAAVTVSELLLGVHRADTVARRTRREAFLDALLEVFPVLPFDLPVAHEYGRLWAELASAGQMIGIHDAQIAATALACRYGVLTENTGEFERVAGLDVASPNWP